MNPETSWKALVAAVGGSIDGDAVQHFGAPGDELAAARDGAAVVPLTQLGVLRVAGPDARAFLQSQLTSDLEQVSPTAAQLSGYCTPKGRLLATFLLVLHGDGYRLVLPRSVAVPLETRLRKYVLRSKVSIAADDIPLLGVCGPSAHAALSQVFPSPPRLPLEAAQHREASVALLPGDCFLLLIDPPRAGDLWARLSRLARPAGEAAWNWRQIRAGVANVLPATQEAFLPQMLGMDTYGAVSLQKGCYPGQEIVARTHYLGNLKRHLTRAFARSATRAGDSLLCSGDEPAGTVAIAAPSPDGGWEMLAVVRSEALADDNLHLADGTPVQLAPTLPPEGAGGHR